jgi:hypothetical protein
MQNLYGAICEFINREWIGTREDSIRAFATDHDIDEKTARQIKNAKQTPYRISLYTLEKICAARGLTLHEFFKLIKR